VDLFSARSRTSFASNLAYSFDLEKARVEKDLLAILEALEEERDKAFNQTEEEEIILSEEEIQLGMDLLSSPDLFDRISSRHRNPRLCRGGCEQALVVHRRLQPEAG
jgi:hypothetical protein